MQETNNCVYDTIISPKQEMDNDGKYRILYFCIISVTLPEYVN